MRKSFLVCILCVAATAGSASVGKAEGGPGVKVEELQYVQDPRTKICYATNYIGPYDSINPQHVITWVPCTPKVLDLIEKTKK